MVIEKITEIALTYPRSAIILISLLVSLISTVITKYTTDQSLLKSIKDRQKEIQKELKEKKYQPTDKKYLELQNEILGLSGKMFKSTFRPLMITMVPFLFLFYFLRNFFGPLFEGNPWWNSWLIYYIVPSIIVSGFYKKIFKVV